MLESGDLITLNNKKEYIVVKQFVFEGIHYIFLIAKDGISEFLICEFENDKIIPIRDAELISKLVICIQNDEVNGVIDE